MHNITFNYSFSSGLGCYEHSRFITDVVMDIILTDDSGASDKIEKIGRVDFLIVNIDEASEGPYSLYEVIDIHSQYLADHAFKFFDPDTGIYINKLKKYYGYDLIFRNFCFIELTTLLPKFRGYGIGAKAIKDILFHYRSGCGLFVIQPFPLQFAYVDDNRYDKLELESFEKNERKAKKKLTDYYKGIGFEAVSGIKDLLFFNPAFKCEEMDSIDLEDPDIFKLNIVK